MKLAGFLVLAIASTAEPALPPPVQRGHLIAGSVAYLTSSPDIHEPAPLSAFTVEDHAELKALLFRLRREQEEADANSGGGSLSLATKQDGSTRMLFQSHRECAIFETWAEQTSVEFAESVQMGFTGIERIEGKIVLHRFVRDDLRKIYSRYTVTVETLSQEGTYRVSFGPPSGEIPENLRDKAAWTLVSPVKYPVAQILKEEDGVGIELYSNDSNDTLRRVIDYIHVGRQDRIVTRKESPHEYYAADAEFTITRPCFLVNGVAYDAGVIPETIRGPVLWVYLPGEGRYVLSFHPYPDLGFDRAGEVAGKSLTFTARDSVFRIEAAERIAAGSGTYTVNVFSDSAWEPADPQDRARIMIGTAPGLIAREPEGQ